MHLFNRSYWVTGLMLVSMTALGGCAYSAAAGNRQMETSPERKSELYGGGMVCNATLFSSGEEEAFSYELPILSREPLHEVSIEAFQVSGDGDYSITQGEMTEGDVYHGWHYYYLHLNVSADPEEAACFSIDSLDLNVDGVPYSYSPRCMKFCNTKALYGKDIPDDSGILLYKEAPEAIFSEIPSDSSHPVTIQFEVHQDCSITGLEALDFLEITSLSWKKNGESILPDAGELPVQKGDTLEVSFCLEYQEGYSDTDLVKTSRILRYRDTQGNDFLLNEPQGFLLIGFENDRMIRNYIDRELS